MTFVSLKSGWALGTAPCGSAACLALMHTSDAGKSWAAVQAPPTTYSGVSAPGAYPASGVGQVRFADPLDGWAFGPDLWTTHDGGVHWRKTNLGSVWSLEAAAGQVHAVVFDPANATLAIASSPASRDAWVKTRALELGAGPVPSADLVLHGSSGWVVENDRAVVDGARLSAGSWVAWHPPCLTLGGVAGISTPAIATMVAVCQEGIWGGSQMPSVRAYFSNNGGSTFYRSGGPLPGDPDVFSGLVASPLPGVVVTQIYTAGGQQLIETFNSALTWQTVASIPASMSLVYIGFTSPAQGVAIAAGSNSSELLMTFDGGRHWSPVTF